MRRIGLLLQYGIDYIIDKLHASASKSISKSIQNSKSVMIICPPGKTVIQHTKPLAKIISLFSHNKICIIHHNPELSENENLFDPPLPSVNLISLSLWSALNTPALPSIQNRNWDLLINMDPENRSIYQYIKRKINPAFIIEFRRNYETSKANFVFKMTSDKMDISLNSFYNFLKLILSTKK